MKRFNENICYLELEHEVKVLNPDKKEFKDRDIEKAIINILLKRFEKTTIELQNIIYKKSEKILNANGYLTFSPINKKP